MDKIYRVGEPLHFYMCKYFLHFVEHGVMPLDAAIYFSRDGSLELNGLHVMPLADEQPVFTLTKIGRKAYKNHRVIWNEIYVPLFEFTSANIPDEFPYTDVSNECWVFSPERLKREQKEGRLGRLLRMLDSYKDCFRNTILMNMDWEE